MPRNRHTGDEAELDISMEPHMPPESAEILSNLRNMWEFASLMQYIFLFGHVVKIDENFDIEDLETECLQPSPSEKLAQIGLALLKYVSSHRGLTPDIFDEYARRQYVAKAPQRNPFGEEEEPIPFQEMDIFTRVRILQQLSTWTFVNSDRIRSLMPQEEDHMNWRMEPLGWDKEDRAYFVLDDNRLYRRGDEAPPPPSPKRKAKPKAKPKPSKQSRDRGTRASKRRKIEDSSDDELEETKTNAEPIDEVVMTNGDQPILEEDAGFGFTSKTWECVAVTLEEYQEFLSSIFRSRDPNEKHLRIRIEEDVLPIIEKRAEALRQKQMKRMRELENLQKMATAKRSNRLADKAEREKQEREEREAEEKHKLELEMARKEQDKQKRIEEGHESRRLTREQRLRDREAKRILHEEQLAKLEEEEQFAQSQEPTVDPVNGGKRISGRQLQTQREQHQKELEKLAEEEGKWIFDCAMCGLHGENLDDGTHSIACDRCNVWQHSKCHGFSPKQAEDLGFSFVCGTCKRKEEEAKRPKIPPIKLGRSHRSTSHESAKDTSQPSTSSTTQSNGLLPHIARQLDGVYAPQHSQPSPGSIAHITNGPDVSLQDRTHVPPNNFRLPPVGNFALNSPQSTWSNNTLPPPRNQLPFYGNHPPPPPPPPPLQAPNGYPSSSHHGHHYSAHQAAVSSSRGHPSYYGQHWQAIQSSGHAPRASPSLYPMPYQSQHQRQSPLPHNPHSSPIQQSHQPSNLSPMNRFQSSTTPDSKRTSSSPPNHQAQSHSSPLKQQHPIFPPMQHSPKTNLPPISELQMQQPSYSPIRTPNQPFTFQLPAYQSSPINSFQPNYAAGRDGLQDHRVQSATTGIAADGMSGPWPDGSKTIPQKQNQSPIPPPPANTIRETKIVPPVTPLAPSPSQQEAALTDTIPVKKMPQPHVTQDLKPQEP